MVEEGNMATQRAYKRSSMPGTGTPVDALTKVPFTDSFDPTRWDKPPTLTNLRGNTQTIREQIAAAIAPKLGFDVDVAFFTPEDCYSKTDWDPLRVQTMREWKLWSPEWAQGHGVHDHEGAVCWRGKVDGEVHIVCIQKLEYREKKLQMYNERARSMMQAPPAKDAPHSSSVMTAESDTYDVEEQDNGELVVTKRQE